MKRSRFFVLVLGTTVLLIVVAHSIKSIVRADLPESTASQIYQPTFEGWAFVNLTASYRDTGGPTHFVSIGREWAKGKVRFKVVGRYAKNPLGQAWFDAIGSKIRKGIENDCKRWTAEGYPIDLKDFEIDIAQVNEKPQ